MKSVPSGVMMLIAISFALTTANSLVIEGRLVRSGESSKTAAMNAAKRFQKQDDARRIKEHQAELAEAYGGLADQKSTRATATAAIGGATTTWTTTLNASTYQPEHHVWAFAPGYSALVGSLFVTTDVESTLYALDAASGHIKWTYNAWPALPKSIAFQRQITGDPKRVIVYRGAVIYYFNATDGAILFAIPLPTNSAVVYVYDGQLLVTYGSTIETYSLSTGLVLWSITDRSDINVVQTQTRDTANADGSKDMVAFSQAVANDGRHFHQVIYNTTTGVRIMRSKQVFSASDALPYIVAVDKDGLYSADLLTNNLTKIDMSGDISYTVNFGPAPLSGYGVAPIDFVFIKLGPSSLATYNRTNGALVSHLPDLSTQGVTKASHLEGYQTFALLVCDMASGATNISAWGATEMTEPPVWTINTNHTDHGHVVFGNWLGIVTIMSTNGLEVLNGNKGGQVIYDGFSKFPDVNFQSLVTTNARETFYFTHSNKVVGMKFTTSE